MKSYLPVPQAVDRKIEAPPAIVWEAGEPHESCPGEKGSTLHIRPLSAAKRKDGEGSPVPEINLVPLLPGMWLGIQPPGMMFVNLPTDLNLSLPVHNSTSFYKVGVAHV